MQLNGQEEKKKKRDVFQLLDKNDSVEHMHVTVYSTSVKVNTAVIESAGRRICFSVIQEKSFPQSAGKECITAHTLARFIFVLPKF